jgi:hypothetical protein
LKDSAQILKKDRVALKTKQPKSIAFKVWEFSRGIILLQPPRKHTHTQALN